MSSDIVVFCRLPVAGRVKTRLAAGVGAAAAAAYYAACAAHTLRSAAACGAECGTQAALHYSDAADADAVSRWLTQLGLAAQLRAAPQAQGASLGSRLRAAFAHSLAQPGVERVVVAGSDVPDLSAAVLRQALDALSAGHELVLGPACDGGYYMIGLTRAAFASAGAQLFDDALPWSTPHLLAATTAAAHASRLRVAPSGTLPTLRDVDTVADLRAWCSERDAAAAPHALAPAALVALEAAGG
jgi:rSAM/selenodomain-associated transferase 1